MSIDLVGFGGLLLSLFFYVAYLSYRFGVLNNEVKNLSKSVCSIEERGDDFKIIVRLEERIINLEKKIEFLFQKILDDRRD